MTRIPITTEVVSPEALRFTSAAARSSDPRTWKPRAWAPKPLPRDGRPVDELYYPGKHTIRTTSLGEGMSILLLRHRLETVRRDG